LPAGREQVRVARALRSLPLVRARHDARYLSWRWDDEGSLVGSFRLPPEQAAVLLQALEAAKNELPAVAVAAAVADAPAEAHPVDPVTDTPAEASMPAGSPRSVDALVQIAASFLDGKRDTAPVGQRERYQLVLHATSEQLARDDDQAADGITSDRRRPAAPGNLAAARP
jgi:hypothetical protein